MKRIFDVIVAGLGLLFLFPVFIIVSMLIVADSKGGVFFRQYRVGRFGKDFRIHKFRTMFIDSEKKGRITVGQDARVTRVGWYLRKYKIDELPQLIDVLSGTMSLVGPRP
ncbi:sugar transferase, partial [Shigella sonnei]